jgi:hypothetical protein
LIYLINEFFVQRSFPQFKKNQTSQNFTLLFDIISFIDGENLKSI